jgi:hypothetical protein
MPSCLLIRVIQIIWIVGLLLSLTSCGSSNSTQIAGVGGDGTGAAPDTVVEGVITGFGSVIVGGIKFDVSQASITVDGVSGRSQADLRVGMVARVNGTVNTAAATGVAKQVAYESTLIGTVDSNSSNNPQAVTLQVLGQTVQADTTTILVGADGLQNIAPGTLVEVSGLRDGQGRVNATWIDVKANAQRAPELFGVIEALSATTFRIGPLTINYANAQVGNAPAGGLSNGLQVRVALQDVPQNNTATAAKVDVRASEFGPNVQFAKVQGVVREYTTGASQFKIDQRVVRISSQTRYFNGDAQTLANDVRLEANGSVAPDGAIEAQAIAFIPTLVNADAYNLRVSAVNAANNTINLFSVPGITVQIDSNTTLADFTGAAQGSFGLSDFKVGDVVQVAGEERSSAVLRARLLQRLPAQPPQVPTTITGAASNITAPTLTVLGVVVQTGSNTQFTDARGVRQSADDFFAALASGMAVRVQGTVENNTLQAQQVRVMNTP